ncbi:MAG: SH3 domain-containing protein [Clostridia bacterium]|nr:SH3 domain-containing protein [Clostridia bacterium]
MKKLLTAIALMLCVLMLLITASAENRTQQEAVSWANSRLSEKWNKDYDGVNGCLDIDLIKYYYNWLGASPVYGYAYAYVNCVLPNGWTRSSTPMQGDIVVWGAKVGIAGQYGHVGIVTKVSGSEITYVATGDGAVQCTSHTVSRYDASTYIHPSFATNAYLDINWRIDGKNEDSAQSAGTVDVYINGIRVANDVNDYYAQHTSGSTYEIKDIEAKSGYRYSGVVSGQLNGKLSGDVSVRLQFDKEASPVPYGTSVVITGNDVPVRSYPNMYANQIGTAAKNTYFTYLGNTSTDERGVNWYEISYYTQIGWVSSRLSALSDDSWQPVSGDTVSVVSGNTNIRSEPNLNCTILGVGYAGSSYEYLGKTAVDDRNITWYQIRYKGAAAWISSKYTQIVHGGSSGDWDDDDWGKQTPKITSVTQSSYLVNNTPVVDGAKAFDGDNSTCWCVREYNYGFGHWVQVNYASKFQASGFTIVNGYNKTRGNSDYWALNSRVSNIAVYCDGSYIGTYKLSDTRSAQTISFGWPVSGSSFQFVIRGAYPGTQYTDVCISEIKLY